MTPEEQEAVEAEYFRELEREAYGAVAGADLGPTRADLDDYEETRQREYDNARGTGFESGTFL